MVRASEIRDEASLRAWFLDCAPHAARAVAFRSAMRVAPYILGSGDHGLRYCRLMLAIGVACAKPSPDMDKCVRAAFAAVGGEVGPLGEHDAPIFRMPGDRTVLRSINGAVRAIEGAPDGFQAAEAQINLNGEGMAQARVYDVQWSDIFADAALAEAGHDIFARPLGLFDEGQPWWGNGIVGAFRARGGGWEFWADWYEGYLTGKPLDLDLLAQVALIPSDEWEKGDDHVNGIIEEIYRDFLDRAPTDVRKEAERLPPPLSSTVTVVRESMERNRDVLPPTFDAIEGLIALEIDRLLSRNYSDDLDRAECRRQIGVFLAMHDAIQALRVKLPHEEPVTEGQAAASERLIRVYMRKFAELPHAKADEVVEGVWEGAKGTVKVGLIGATAVLGVAYGLPVGIATAVGAMVFAPKNAADLIKAAREAVVSGKGG